MSASWVKYVAMSVLVVACAACSQGGNADAGIPGGHDAGSAGASAPSAGNS